MPNPDESNGKIIPPYVEKDLKDTGMVEEMKTYKKTEMSAEDKAKLKSELDSSLKGIENSIGAFGGSTAGLAFVYRKLIVSDPAIMFGEETEQDALDMDRQTNDSIIEAARNSKGFSHQLFEWVGKYNDTDPELKRLNESLTKNATLETLSDEEKELAEEQDEVDKENREADLNYIPSSRFQRFTRLFSRGVSSVGGIKDEGLTTIIPYLSDAVGKEMLPLLLNMRPSPKMIVKLLDYVPTFRSPYETFKYISNKAIAKIDPSGTHIAPMADRILSFIAPIVMPLLRFISKTLEICLKGYTKILNTPWLAKYINMAVRGFYKLLGWIYRILGKLISFVIVLVYAIIKFVVSIVLTVVGNTAVTLVVTTILDLIHM